MERLTELFEILREIEIETLERKGSEYEFTEVYPKMEEMYNNYIRLGDEPNYFNQISEENKETIKRNLNLFVNIAEKIKEFKGHFDNSYETRKSLFEEIINIFERSYNERSNFDLYLKKKQEKESERISKAMKSVSSETGLGIFGGFFEKFTVRGVFGNQATINSLIALFFLIMGIAIACFIYKDLHLLLDKLTDMIEKNSDASISFQVILIRIVIISFLTFIFYQVIRIFNINMHLYTINKHRKNVLKAYTLLVDGTENLEAKDEIINQATKTIFEHGETGYLSSKDSKVPLLEIIKMIEKSDKTS